MEELYPVMIKFTSLRSLKFKVQLNSCEPPGNEDPGIPQVEKYWWLALSTDNLTDIHVSVIAGTLTLAILAETQNPFVCDFRKSNDIS